MFDKVIELFYLSLYLYNVFVIIYFFAINTGYIILNILAFFDIKKYLTQARAFHLKELLNTDHYLPISVIVPAYNEELNIVETVKSLIALEYSQFEIIVVSDGSSDKTVEKLVKEFELEMSDRFMVGSIRTADVLNIYESNKRNHILCIEKENGGKADAINAGINCAIYPIVGVIDADSVLESDALLKTAFQFFVDKRTVAVGGIIRLANGCDIEHGHIRSVDLPKSFIARLQVVEYLRAFLFGRCGWNAMNGMLIISGAFGLFKRDLLIELGGYKRDCIGEDMEMVMRIHKHMLANDREYVIKFIPDPVCWTEAPEDYKTLAKQRNRWQRGLLTCLYDYKFLLFNKQYKIIGRLVYPFVLFFEGLNPLFEFLGYVVLAISLVLGVVDSQFAILFWIVAILLSCVLSLLTIILEELSFRRYPKLKHLLIMFIYAIFENFGYRQIHSYWRFQGMVDYFRGKNSWGNMVRTGLKGK